METKRVKLQLKSLEEDGTFVGLCSVYNTRDLGGDVVLPGAFTKTIQEKSGRFPLLDEHAVNVGVSRVEEIEDGLLCKGKLNLDVQAARELHSNMKFYQEEGLQYGMSFGFKSVPGKFEFKNSSRYLKEVRLFETTLTVIPLNDGARVAEVKTFMQYKADFNTELEAAQTWAQRYQMISALDQALYSIIWNDKVTPEQKVEQAGESIDQFRATCLEFLPKMLALMDSRYKSAVAEIEQKDGREIFSAQRIDVAEKSLRALLTGAAPESTEPAADHSGLNARADSILTLFR